MERDKGGKGAAPAWDGAAVRAWLQARILAARADQVAAERRGREGQDDCDAAAAEEMVCTLLLRGAAADERLALVEALKELLDRDDYVWRGVYDDRRFDRHARTAARKVLKMARANEGWDNHRRYQ